MPVSPGEFVPKHSIFARLFLGWKLRVQRRDSQEKSETNRQTAANRAACILPTTCRSNNDSRRRGVGGRCTAPSALVQPRLLLFLPTTFSQEAGENSRKEPRFKLLEIWKPRRACADSTRAAVFSAHAPLETVRSIFTFSQQNAALARPIALFGGRC